MSGKEIINSALAGEGNPIKLVVCLSSLLNFARRRAAKMGTASPIQQKIGSWINLTNIIPGTTPNETISASESRSLPMGDFTFNALAASPSKKSATAAPITNHDAIKVKSLEINTSAIHPQSRFRRVIAFGILFRIKLILV